MKKLLLVIFLVCSISILTSAQELDTLRSYPFRQYVPQEQLDKFNLRQMIDQSQRALHSLPGDLVMCSMAPSLCLRPTVRLSIST
jgi:hypothetical protein